MKRVGTQELFSYAVFFLCLSVVLFTRAEEWWEAPDWRPTPNDEEAFVQDYPDEHQFLAACRQGRVDVMEYWLSQKGFRPNDEFISGYAGEKVSGLRIASQDGHINGVKLLIKAGADLNQTRNDGSTSLFMASQNGHAKAVEILVKAGADLNQTRGGVTPLFMASKNGHAEVVQILVKAGADLNQGHDDGATPLFIASQNGHAEAVEILIQAEADLNQARDDGTTPLFMASQYGHAGVVGILVKAGADPLKKCHHHVLFNRGPLEAAKLSQPSWQANPEAYERYALTIQTLKPAVKAWKEQKKIQAQLAGNTGCFDEFVCALKEGIKHAVAPHMTRAPLKSKGY